MNFKNIQHRKYRPRCQGDYWLYSGSSLKMIRLLFEGDHDDTCQSAGSGHVFLQTDRLLFLQ